METNNNIGLVYPMSVAEGVQTGEITVVGKAMLIRHYCGFAHIMSRCDDRSLEDIFELMSKEHFRLFSDDKETIEFLKSKGAEAADRYFYEYQSDTAPEISLPEGFSFCEIDKNNIGRLNGRIVPSFSWDDEDKFLANGRGYCIMDGDTPVSWAFSAAVSSKEIDIGVETAEAYRGKGLAALAAKKMIEYVLSQGKKPVWACHASNIGSQRTAEKAGFTKTAECTVLTVQE